ncbi:MAG TPA: glycogen/starch synthase, partial [Gemmatimonadales bacterium]|nr:glycogen/starch synthase [Gemmatimonadales bacterium]
MSPPPESRSSGEFRALDLHDAPLSIVHLAAEYGWLARTGGLAEAVAGLAATQAAQGIPVAVVMPLHRSV